MENFPITPLFLTTQLRSIEQAAQKNLPAGTLMQRAGAAAASLVKQILPSRSSLVWILAGPGNNGGDGFVLAQLLKQHGYHVQLFFCDEEKKQPADAAAAKQIWVQQGGTLLAELPASSSPLPDLIVDALFGIGLTRAISGKAAAWITHANHLNCKKLALDIPSGLNADTGQIAGQTTGQITDPLADTKQNHIVFRAHYTATFIAGKPGLYTVDGVDYAGEVFVYPLDLNFTPPQGAGQLNTQPQFTQLLPRLAHPSSNTHKGSFGKLAIIGGQCGMIGAALLAGQAGLLTGAGRVYLHLLDRSVTTLPSHPELMLPSIENIHHTAADCLVMGPGMGTSEDAHQILLQNLRDPAPLVLDADALNLIADEPAAQQRIQHRQHPTVMTPHPLEAARLLETTLSEVQSNRIHSACTLAKKFNALIVLKGAGSVLAEPNGNWLINPFANPLLSAPGSGDVLSGIIGSLIAQHLPAWPALCAAVWLHGQAGEQLTQHFPRKIGVTASEIAYACRAVLNQIPLV